MGAPLPLRPSPQPAGQGGRARENVAGSWGFPRTRKGEVLQKVLGECLSVGPSFLKLAEGWGWGLGGSFCLSDQRPEGRTWWLIVSFVIFFFFLLEAGEWIRPGAWF